MNLNVFHKPVLLIWNFKILEDLCPLYSRNAGHSGGRAWDSCVQELNSNSNPYSRVFLTSPLHWNSSRGPTKDQKTPSFPRLNLLQGSQPQSAPCSGTFWVCFSSCFTFWSWFRYSVTFRLAVFNFSCSAFTSGLSAFEERNILGEDRILREKLKWLRSMDPSGPQIYFFQI